jgi:hypothetical protein
MAIRWHFGNGNPLALGDDHLLPVRDDNPRWRFGPGVVMGDGWRATLFFVTACRGRARAARRVLQAQRIGIDWTQHHANQRGNR